MNKNTLFILLPIIMGLISPIQGSLLNLFQKTPPPVEKWAVVNLEQTTPTALSVMPLTPREGQGEAWLSKGLADMLIRNLSEVQSLVILEREKMQTFTEEVELQKAGIVSQEKALQIGRVSAVQQVLYGNYNLDGNKVSVSIFLLDMKTQEIIQKEEISGDLGKIQDLVKKLVYQFLKNRGVKLSKAERQKIQYKATDSIDAIEHFYTGLDLYDRGAYPDSLGSFFAAYQQDKNYSEAYLWVGKIFEAMGFYDQAVLTYQNVFFYEKTSVEGRDALYLSGRLLETHLNQIKKAITTYKALVKLKPLTPHTIEAAFRLGDLYQKRGSLKKAYQAFGVVDLFRAKAQKNRSWNYRTQVRQSGLLSWKRALDRYQDAVVHRVTLFQKLIETVETQDLPDPPRGVFLPKANNPIITEKSFGETPSLFFRKKDHYRWKEEFYAVLAPKGYVITGTDLIITGRLLEMKPYFSFDLRVLPFPLHRDYFRFWLGAVFGQTPRKDTLRKPVSFHGENRKIATLHLLENMSEIDNWGVKVWLKPEKEVRDSSRPLKKSKKEFWEGKPAGEIYLPEKTFTGATRPYLDTYRDPKKEIALLRSPGGVTYFVTAEGELDGNQTDLWFSKKNPRRQWTSLKKLPINSASDDTNPRLLLAEDGKIWLTWASRRRGKGWELWLSHLNKNETWSHPHRVPIEEFIDGNKRRSDVLFPQLLEYDIIQNQRGRWIVSLFDPSANQLAFLTSSDTKKWAVLTGVPTNENLYGLSLIEDKALVYRLSAMSESKHIYLLTSKNGRNWQTQKTGIPFWQQNNLVAPTIHRTQLHSLRDGSVLLTTSDNVFGLQFSKFNPDSEKPFLDLVARSGLEPYAITKNGSGKFLVALKQNDKIVFKKYKKFTLGKEVDKDTPNWSNYFEVQKDSSGNQWIRLFAHERYRVSDVTSLGVEPSGRIWWGMETGIMFKYNDFNFAMDVSQGFFHHFITDISGCEGRTWLSSDYLPEPRVGYVQSITSFGDGRQRPRIETVTVPGFDGSIQAQACAEKSGHVIVGSSKGQLARLNGDQVLFKKSLGEEVKITSLAFDKKTNTTWIGTENHGIFHLKQGKEIHYTKENKLPSNQINAIEVEKDGTVWAALNNQGLMRFRNGKWKQFTPKNSGVLYWSSEILKADPKKGIWYLPHKETKSIGLGFFDGKKSLAYNPPHAYLDRPSSMDIDKNGHIWIGTWFDGVYELIPKGITK